MMSFGRRLSITCCKNGVCVYWCVCSRVCACAWCARLCMYVKLDEAVAKDGQVHDTQKGIFFGDKAQTSACLFGVGVCVCLGLFVYVLCLLLCLSVSFFVSIPTPF